MHIKFVNCNIIIEFHKAPLILGPVMANSNGFILFLVLCVDVTFIVHAQQQTGFISIDCGGPANFEYTDDTIGIKYGTDGSYIQTGLNRNISADYAYPKNPNLPFPLSDLRSFPQGNRNCYRLIAGRNGSLHLIRASFLYGNYDGENKLPEFDLYVGVNFWSTVKFKNASEQVTLEIISMATSEETDVCLVNKGKGIPFISALELRPVDSSIYKTEFGDSASSLLFRRWDIGSFNGSGRYQDDVYDRIWLPLNSSSWKSISTSSKIDVSGDGYKAPFEVISNAATPRNVNDSLEFSWMSDDPNLKFNVYLYFAEFEKLNKTQLREFNVSWNGSPLINSIIPKYLQATTVFNSKSLVANEHRISIRKTEDSTLPPILNAVEIYVVRQHGALPTSEEDAEAIKSVRDNYRVQRNWVGDPCEPKNYTWEGIKCNSSTLLPPRIVSLNLSRSSLSGIITPSIANLTFLESLDLYNNSLIGSIPQFLEELKSLKYLDLRGNQLSGFVSTTLIERSRNGLLTLRVDDINLSDSNKSDTNKAIVPIVATLSSVILVLLIIAILYWKLRRRNEPSEDEMHMINKGTVVSKKLQYTYAEVLDITSNLEIVIGRGGFGSVYSGQMKDGNKVAVKMLSASSAQGPKEFQTEAELLMTVHHKNLVSFIGYCDEGDKMALIYEYMANGNLKENLSEKSSRCLSWERRLQIAIDAAEVMTNSIGFILLLVFWVGVTVLVHAQQQTGFISIDCGGPENFEYTDEDTKIKYVTDGPYIQTGINRNISSDYAYPKNPNLPYPLSDLRSFPRGNWNCYRLIAGTKGSLHLIRASFLYGNYDGENKLPEFDLYVGVNFWSSVKFKNASEQVALEIISMATSEETNVCLVNKGKGIPFISALELRPVDSSGRSSASLLLFKRWDIGSFNGSGRYQDDVYDRIWFPLNSSSWKSISTSSNIDVNGDGYKPPFEVIRNAATPRNENDSLEFSWISDDPNLKFNVYLYFAEVEKLNKTQLRKFTVDWNGSPLIKSIIPRYLQATTVFNSKSLVANEHRISIQKTEDSTLPPILNAVEIYVVRQLDALPTSEEDGMMYDTRVQDKLNK